MSTRSLSAFVLAALALFISYMPLQAVTASATEATIVDQMDAGELTVTGPIRGTLERTTQFEVVPGGEFTFDMNLVNTDEGDNSAFVELQIVLPTGADRVMYSEEMVLEGQEVFEYNYENVIPEDLQLYGRYTVKLLIDQRLADYFQFDLNSRGGIVVRWDDGILANAWAFFDAGNKWAIRGCMPPGAIVDEIGVHVLAENDPFWPWPDDVHQTIELILYDQDGAGGTPGTVLFSERVTPPTSGDAVAFPGIGTPNTGFFVSNHQLDPFPECEGQGVDEAVNHADQMFQEVDGAWTNTWTSGDYMIWAIGHLPSGQQITIGNPPPVQ